MRRRVLYYIDKFLALFDISWLVATKPKINDDLLTETTLYEPLLLVSEN